MSAFTTLLRQAVNYFAKRGFTTVSDVNGWMVGLSTAAENHLATHKAQARVERALRGAFYRWMGRGKVTLQRQGVPKWANDHLEPKMREELERRMFAGREAIDAAHRVALETIHRRFMGFATAGAQPQPGVAQEAAKHITKAAKDAKAQERMTAINETTRLVQTIEDIRAADGGSIGGYWDATFEIPRKHRPEHAARDGKFYVRRGAWADEEGLLRHPSGYMDQHDMPGVLINCRCEYRYVYDLEDCPPGALTAKGKRAA